MWASFGMFSAAENRALLEAMKAKLRPGGRLVLDVWNHRFFQSRQGRRELLPGIVETSIVEGGRRRVLIDYGDERGELDHELFTPAELRELVGLPCVYEQADDDEARLLMVFSDRGGWFPPHVYEEHYLRGEDPRAQSGFGGDEARWKAARRPIAEAVDRPGSFLDVGCANGYLLESLVRWSRHRLEPYGLDSAPALVELARERLPRWADRIFLGDAPTWELPQRFDFVRTELVYAPKRRQAELVERLLADVVAPGGRLIVCGYGSPRSNVPTHPVCELVRSFGYEPALELVGIAPEGGPLVEIAVIEART
jgi:SAM-dependent methyltransferase